MWLFLWSIYLLIVGVFQIRVVENSRNSLSAMGNAVSTTAPSIRESFVAFVSNQSACFVSACAERHAQVGESDHDGNVGMRMTADAGGGHDRQKCNAVPGDFSHRVDAMAVELFIAPVFTTTTTTTLSSKSLSAKTTIKTTQRLVMPDTDMFDAFATRRALRSYRRLMSPPPRITVLLPPSVSNTSNRMSNSDHLATLLSSEPGVTVDRRVDTNFLGTPQFNSLVERANQSQADITVLLTCGFGGGSTVQHRNNRHGESFSSSMDVSLPRSFMASLRRVAATFDDFLLVSARFEARDVGLSDTPMRQAGSNSSSTAADDETYDEELRRHVLRAGRLHTASESIEDNDEDDDDLGVAGGGIDVTVWAWNTNGPRLFDDTVKMPPFTHAAGLHDDWLTQQAVSAGRRTVIDATETSLVVRLLSSSDSDSHSDSNSDAKDQAMQSRAALRAHLRAAAAFARRVDLTRTSAVHDKLLSHSSVSTDDTLSLSRKAHLLQRLINLYLSFSFSSRKSPSSTVMNGRLRHHIGRSGATTGGVLSAPWKLVRCVEKHPGLYDVCITRRLRPDVCPCEQTTFTRGVTRADPIRLTRGSRVVQCGRVAELVVGRGNASVIPAVIGKGSGWRGVGVRELDAGGGPQLMDDRGRERAEEQPFGWPLTLPDVVDTFARRAGSADDSGDNGDGDDRYESDSGSGSASATTTVFVTAALSASATHLMSWVCNLRLLSLSNFIVAALDKSAYRYAYLRGLPVYFFHHDHGTHQPHDPTPASAAGASAAVRYANAVDARTAREEPLPLVPLAVQLGIVAQVLRLGMNVVWVDCHDETVRFVSNPLPDLREQYLSPHGAHADIAVLPTGTARGEGSGSVRKARNSRHGLFVAAASKRMAALLEHIVTTTSSSSYSSRNSSGLTLYDTLCMKTYGLDDDAGEPHRKCEYNGKTVAVAVLDHSKYVVLGDDDGDKDINVRSYGVGDAHDVDVDVVTARRKWPGVLVLSARQTTARRGTRRGWGETGKGQRIQLFDERNEVCSFEWAAETGSDENGDGDEGRGRSGRKKAGLWLV